MKQTKKNYFLIGFIASILISLFVNFSLLTMNYKLLMENDPQFPVRINNEMLYTSLVWFFAFAFILFIVNIQGHTIGEKLAGKSGYKSIISVVLCSLVLMLAGIWFFPERQRPKPSHMQVQSAAYSIPQNMPEKHGDFRFFDGPKPFFTEHLFITLVVILSVMLMRLLSNKQQMLLEYEQLKTEKLQTSYNALMGQINPHFFFNSLNGLSSLINTGNKEQTLTYLNELSEVFRYILQSNKKEMVTLAEELQFVKAYTYLLSVRYEGKLFFSIQTGTHLLLYKLPILSILPLIENAVKHNVISRQYPLLIDVYTNTDNCLVVSNPIQSKIEESAGNGIGLKNLWGRYRLLTGKDIMISNRKEYFKVTLPLVGSSKPTNIDTTQ